MRKTLAVALAGLLLIGGALPAAAQYRDRGRDNDRFGSVTQERAEWRRADNALNRAYERAIADARRSDREDRRGAGWYSREIALRNAQRAWIPLRDADCRYEVQQFRRDREAANFQCLTEQTEARTAYLREALEDGPQRYSAR
jgi:uncharacterized protein YecT (DUF1311 family)